MVIEGQRATLKDMGIVPSGFRCGMAKPALQRGTGSLGIGSLASLPGLQQGSFREKRDVVCSVGQDRAGRKDATDVHEDAAGAVFPP